MRAKKNTAPPTSRSPKIRRQRGGSYGGYLERLFFLEAHPQAAFDNDRVDIVFKGSIVCGAS
ncbi:MAG: hypothetical protein KDJ47_00165, partial [Hyphomicrobiaceae bacterium]|nr:hypothetical protein [Hyphomicrobiaceae bacterium]